MSSVIVDYNAGNLASVQRACRHVGMDITISSDPDAIRRADKLVFPGVGSAESAVDTLAEKGLDEAILDFYHGGKPLLGICLGLQIALDFTEEGRKNCLGIVPGACERFEFADRHTKIPQIGWNQVTFCAEHRLLGRNRSGDDFYFVHSYYAKLVDNANCLGITEHGGTSFASIIANNNFVATQFHPEKSGELGLRLLSSFADWDGRC